MNKIQILKEAISEVLSNNKGQVYLEVIDYVENEFGAIEQEQRYELIQDVEEYEVEELYVKDKYNYDRVGKYLQDAICDMESPVEEKLFELINQDNFEDENEYYEHIMELREEFKELYDTKEMQEYIREQL